MRILERLLLWSGVFCLTLLVAFVLAMRWFYYDVISGPPPFASFGSAGVQLVVGVTLSGLGGGLLAVWLLVRVIRAEGR